MRSHVLASVPACVLACVLVACGSSSSPESKARASQPGKRARASRRQHALAAIDGWPVTSCSVAPPVDSVCDTDADGLPAVPVARRASASFWRAPRASSPTFPSASTAFTVMAVYTRMPNPDDPALQLDHARAAIASATSTCGRRGRDSDAARGSSRGPIGGSARMMFAVGDSQWRLSTTCSIPNVIRGSSTEVWVADRKDYPRRHAASVPRR